MRRKAITAASLLLLASCPVLEAQGNCDLVWTTVPADSPGDVRASLGPMALISDSEIWAVGGYQEGKGRKTMAQRWDGERWSIVPTPNGPRSSNFLTGISAVSSDDIWVSGYSADIEVGSVESETMVQHWDGESWKIIPTPNLTEADVPEEFGGYPVQNELYGIAAAADDDVWAVGRSYTFSAGQELVIHWNGESWSVVPTPHPGLYGWLRGILAVSSDDVWAFGESYLEITLPGEEGGTGNLQQNLILRWNGTEWSVVPSPNLGPAVNGLFGGSVVAPDDIWAVGYHLEVFGVNQLNHPSMLHWDGVEWTPVPVEVHNREQTYLFSVSAFSSEDAFAVGFYDTGPPQPKILTLIEHWDGLQWKILPSADPHDLDYLYGVAAVFADDVWAVGEGASGEILGGIIIERYTSACLEGVFLRGDSNSDGTVDISDPVATLNFLFLGGEEPSCFDALDADDDGGIVITDAIFVLDFLFQGGVEIPLPRETPGFDPTQDDPYDCRNRV